MPHRGGRTGTHRRARQRREEWLAVASTPAPGSAASSSEGPSGTLETSPTVVGDLAEPKRGHAKGSPRARARRRVWQREHAQARLADAGGSAGAPAAGSAASSSGGPTGALATAANQAGRPGRPACNVCRGPCERPQEHFPDRTTAGTSPRRVGADTARPGFVWRAAPSRWARGAVRLRAWFVWRAWVVDLEHRILIALETEEFLVSAE